MCAYYVLNEVKRLCGIATSDTTYDTLLGELGAKADRYTDNIMSDVASATPATGSEVISATQTAISNFRTTQLYAMEAHDDDLYEKAKELLQSEISAYRVFLKSIPTTRAQPTIAEAAFISPLIVEDDWNGESSDVGSTI